VLFAPAFEVRDPFFQCRHLSASPSDRHGPILHRRTAAFGVPGGK